MVCEDETTSGEGVAYNSFSFEHPERNIDRIIIIQRTDLMTLSYNPFKFLNKLSNLYVIYLDHKITFRIV